jgi:hypothetical protein
MVIVNILNFLILNYHVFSVGEKSEDTSTMLDRDEEKTQLRCSRPATIYFNSNGGID